MYKKLHKEEVEMKEGRDLGHKLNITDRLTNKIISIETASVILSVEISRHHTIFLLESHCNTLRNIVGIYQQNFSVSIFTDEFYHRVNFIGNYVYKTYMLSYCLLFLFFFFHCNFLGKYRENISIGVYRQI
jgi:hypothetical protein